MKSTIINGFIAREQIYLIDDPERFAVESYSWRCVASGTKKDRLAKLPKEVEEELQAEVQWLHAENEYPKTYKLWFWKTSDTSAKNAGNSETKAKTILGDSPFYRSIASRYFLLVGYRRDKVQLI